MNGPKKKTSRQALVRIATEQPSSSAPSLIEAFNALTAHAASAQRIRNQRELTLFESEPERIGRMVDFLIVGGYRERAAQAAGIAPSSVRSWLRQAADGDRRYFAVAELIDVAEALAEARQLSVISAHAKREWTAAAWLLERKYPERWGRRQDAEPGPKVIVQIGATSADIEHVAAQIREAALRRTSNRDS